ncbi:MAG: tyrosine-type recombinase/integrase [Desulfobacterales bacterium]|nr:tyrosine-type recombinase/integrase [Desulfobacterales bacterium]
MKSELKRPQDKAPVKNWIIDESKCLNQKEVDKLREVSIKFKVHGLKARKFSFIRNWFMIELGLNTGLRVEEMASVKHSDLFINEAKSSIVVIGKGNKRRVIWINADFKKTINKYINLKRLFNYTVSDNSHLLINLKGNKISKRALQKFFKEMVQKADLPSHYHIHCLRHTYTTFLLKASSNNYRFVQKQLGHASIRTTQVYASVIESERKDAVEKLYK